MIKKRKKSFLIKIISLVLLSILAGTFYWYYQTKTEDKKELFKTQKPQRRSIDKIIPAEGSLEALGTSRIGSLISARVTKIYVQEGDKVTAGQLLAKLENSSGGDTDLRRAEADLEAAQASYEYQKFRFESEEKLYKTGHRSQDALNKAIEQYKGAQAAVKRARALYDKERFLLQQTEVTSPIDGIVVSIPTKVGQTFSPYTSPPQVLFEVAKKLDTMKATLLVDENKMGDIALGMPVKLEVDAFPYKKPWRSTIKSLGLSKTSEGQSGGVSYEAEVELDNNDALLRPGMTVHAKIRVGRSKEALAVPGYVFQLNPEVLKQAAKQLGYGYESIDQVARKELMNSQKNPVRIVWIMKDKKIIERLVTIGVTDNAYFQILEGVSEADDIIADDMTASEEVKRLAQQMAG